ncbi:MAG: thioredoxin family protein [Planctomycetaceae bacterium]
MLRRLCGTCLAGLTLLLAAPAVAVEWKTDLEQARQDAKEQGKDLLVYFTSSDGCAWCRVLERVVLDTDKFAQAEENYVLVKLDIPVDAAELGEENLKRNVEQKDRWGVVGYPSLVLADVELRPYGMIVGHQPDGPKAVLRMLDDARTARQRRDELFATAATAKPAKQAKLLDKALAALPLDAEVLAQLYRPEIESIVAATNDEDVRRRYRNMLNAEADRLFQEEIKRRIVERAGENIDSKLAVAVLDEALTVSDLPESRRDWLLERKAIYLWTEGSYARAVEALDEMLEGDDPHERPAKEIFRAQLVYLAGRQEEGLKRLDELAETYVNIPKWRWSALDRKAQVLQYSDRREEAIVASDIALAAAARPSDRYDSQEQRTELLTALGRHDEAATAARDRIAACREAGLPDTITARSLLSLAETLSAGGSEIAAAVAAQSARRMLERNDPAAMAREEIAAGLANYPPFEPVETLR